MSSGGRLETEGEKLMRRILDGAQVSMHGVMQARDAERS
jgi:hypothetical protein